MMRIASASLRKVQRGSIVVEAAIVWPALFLMIFGVIHAGLWFHARNLALGAAQEGARAASGESRGNGVDYANRFVSNNSLLDVDTITQRERSKTVTVTVAGSSPTLVPGWTMSVQQSATAPFKRWSDS